MDLVTKLNAIIAPVLDGMGYELVRVQVMGDRRVVLQIMADRADGKGMTVEDCARISRQISAVLDVEDPISEAYTLEVSSPGIDRPLTRLKDFTKWAGFDGKVELREALDGRKRFSGKLLGLDDAGAAVLIEVEGETHSLPFELIGKAKLTLTDALINAVTLAEEAAAEEEDEVIDPEDDLGDDDEDTDTAESAGPVH